MHSPSEVAHYLQAVKAGTDEAGAVLDALDGIELDEFFVTNGDLYPNGRLIHNIYPVEVGKPDEVTEKADFLKLVATVPAL